MKSVVKCSCAKCWDIFVTLLFSLDPILHVNVILRLIIFILIRFLSTCVVSIHYKNNKSHFLVRRVECKGCRCCRISKVPKCSLQSSYQVSLIKQWNFLLKKSIEKGIKNKFKSTKLSKYDRQLLQRIMLTHCVTVGNAGKNVPSCLSLFIQTIDQSLVPNSRFFFKFLINLWKKETFLHSFLRYLIFFKLESHGVRTFEIKYLKKLSKTPPYYTKFWLIIFIESGAQRRFILELSIPLFSVFSVFSNDHIFDVVENYNKYKNNCIYNLPNWKECLVNYSYTWLNLSAMVWYLFVKIFFFIFK